MVPPEDSITMTTSDSLSPEDSITLTPFESFVLAVAVFAIFYIAFYIVACTCKLCKKPTAPPSYIPTRDEPDEIKRRRKARIADFRKKFQFAQDIIENAVRQASRDFVILDKADRAGIYDDISRHPNLLAKHCNSPALIQKYKVLNNLHNLSNDTMVKIMRKSICYHYYYMALYDQEKAEPYFIEEFGIDRPPPLFVAVMLKERLDEFMKDDDKLLKEIRELRMNAGMAEPNKKSA